MFRYWHPVMALAAIALLACADDAGPTTPTPVTAVGVAQYPLETEVAHLKNRGFIAPSIDVTIDAHEARAEASISYFANYVRLTVNMNVKRDHQTLLSRSSTPQEVSRLLPTAGWLNDGITIAVSQSCGLSADGDATGLGEIRALHGTSLNVISLWSSQVTRTDLANQPSCPPPTHGGGSNPYDDGQCQLCLEWTWYIGNQEVDRVWQCSAPVPCPAS